MKIPREPHGWGVTPSRAVAIQRTLAARVRAAAPRRKIGLVAGVDAAFTDDGRGCLAAAVVWDLARSTVVERRTAQRPVRFPYIPGLLSFREAPAVIAALRELRSEVDAVMCDGHGLAHPRRFGLACHVGLLVGRPTLGCAKSRLCGRHRDPGRRRGSQAPLRDGDEILGTVLRTRDEVKPVYVSVGHAIDLAGAVRLVLDCGTGYRLPEPTRLADILVTRVKRDRATSRRGRSRIGRCDNAVVRASGAGRSSGG